MKAKSIKGKSPEEVEAALQESMADGFTPTLAIVFISIKQNIDAISKLLDAQNIAVFGATTNGEFIDEDLGKESVAILLLDIHPSYFSISFDEFPEKNYREVAQALAKKALKKISNPAFLIAASNLETNGEQLLFGLEDAVGKQVNIFGGMAGDDMMLTNQFVFTKEKCSNRGLIMLVLDEDKIIIKGKATSGWKAVGTEKIVTKSEGPRVYTIENVPALDICLKYGGLSEDDPKLAIELITNFPLQLQRANGDPVMRPAYKINWEDRSLTTSGEVPQGSKVKFSLPPDFDVIEKVIEGCRQSKEYEMPEADALIIFNCAGRFLSLGPLISKEIEGLNAVWSVPLVGMFSNAEIGRATNGNNEFHNLTCVWVAMKEK